MRLLIWSIVIVALVATGGYLAGFWGPPGDTDSAPATDGIGAVEGSTPRPAPTAGPTDAAAGFCVELQQVEVLTNEMALIMNAVIQEFTASSGEPDEAVLQARLQEAADLMDRSLPGLLSAYESAAQLAPADVAADLRAVADGTALLTPPMVDVMRNARTVEDFAGMEQVLEAPELAQAAVAAGTASLRLDEFTIPTCGFKFSN
jgi:hypothetical protein